MENQKEKSRDIELRSEKVRNIIGQIPPFLVRSGMGMIAVVVALALGVCYFIPYYETVEGRVEILGDYGQILLPYEYQWKIQTGQQVRVELDGFPSTEFGTLRGVISEIYPSPIKDPTDNQLFLKVEMDLPERLTTSNKNELPFTPGMQGTATVVVSKRRLLLELFAK